MKETWKLSCTSAAWRFCCWYNFLIKSSLDFKCLIWHYTLTSLTIIIIKCSNTKKKTQSIVVSFHRDVRMDASTKHAERKAEPSARRKTDWNAPASKHLPDKSSGEHNNNNKHDCPFLKQTVARNLILFPPPKDHHPSIHRPDQNDDAKTNHVWSPKHNAGGGGGRLHGALLASCSEWFLKPKNASIARCIITAVIWTVAWDSLLRFVRFILFVMSDGPQRRCVLA